MPENTSNNQSVSSSFLKNKFLNLGYLPRWVIFSIDIAIVLFANLVTYLIVSNLTFKYYDTASVFQRTFIIVFTQIFFFFVFKSYAGIIRHSTLNDGFNLFKSTFSTFLALAILNYAHFYWVGSKIFLMPALVLTFLISFIFLLSFRIAVKIIYQVYIEASQVSSYQKVVIYGTDSHAIALANAIKAEQPRKYKLVGFVDKYKNKATKTILDVPILSHDKSIVKILDALNAKNLIIADRNISNKLQLLIVDQCLEHNIKLLTVPVVADWNNQKRITKSIKTFEILDLLDRKPIVLDNTRISNQLTDKIVLITGAAGSIGSEIVRQVLAFKPRKILVLDQAETPLYQLVLELEKVIAIEIVSLIADVRDKEQMRKIFEKYQPQFVFHAAAYKHVPLMEENPTQAIYTNVLGTKNMADLAVKFKVERFVMVSTDKAVNPSNVMGASKRIAEKYVQSLSVYLEQMKESSTKFITTRFGNVLGSNGSVVPLFTKQINEGGPLTITHPDIIRYFMTIPEACQLVLEAGAMGNGGEIYIFDMGKPVKIIDLAEKMIRLAGYVPNEDIEIKVVGLRPGEKLYEELLNDATKTLPTHHEKIMIAKDELEDYISISTEIDELIEIAKDKKPHEVVAKMKIIVPEFVSLNSEYQSLDN